jgi:uncharacterized protein DUF1549/uncharacterized protein DUF1553
MKLTVSQYLFLAGSLLGAALMPATPAWAGSAAKKPAAGQVQPAAKLASISVVPSSVKLVGKSAEQGLIVTGTYSDGSVRDLTTAAQYRVSNPAVAALAVDESRRVIRPRGDGTASITVTAVGAAPVNVPVAVEKAGDLAPVSFRNEVVPALTKAGCNQGTCHGTPTGKGGFRLSLQGYNPEMDYQTLVSEGAGRRVNKAEPGRSLLLLKPMVELPHAGGKRLSPEMPEFQVLSRWIAEGAQDDTPETPKFTKLEILPGKRTLMLPGAKQQIAAVAHFSDGTVRDVTSLAKLTTSDDEAATITREGLVEADKRGDIAVVVRYQDALQTVRLTFLQNVPGFKWNDPPEANLVDKHVFDRLRLFQIPASELSSDTEFLRRAYLDALGVLPTPDEVRAFMKDTAPDKRARLIDALTERPEFADFWALKWADILRIQDETMKDQGARAFHKWVRDSLAANKPMDRFVREIVTASGPTFQNAPANFFRAIDDPAEQSESVAQLFLGVRMLCAKCHNHPFERWTQDEYYQLAAFFSQVRGQRGPSKDEMTIQLDPNGQVTHLRTGKVMQPKLLGADFPEIEKNQDRRQSLAEWMTRKDNPFFAKVMVNRVWANLLGRGIVEPVDDFRESNPPVNEPLLEALAKDFADHSFDLRHLVRRIMNSRTYQLSAHPLPLNKDDQTYFSHALPRIMAAEQLLDAISQVTGMPEDFPGYPKGTRAVQLAGTKARTPFLKTFGRPDRNLTCECEREKDPTLLQALTLISGRNVHGKLRSESGRIATLAKSQKPNEEVLEELYLASLSRLPSDREKKGWLAHFAKSGDRQQALEDLGWVLINSKEFLFRH